MGFAAVKVQLVRPNLPFRKNSRASGFNWVDGMYRVLQLLQDICLGLISVLNPGNLELHNYHRIPILVHGNKIAARI